MRRRFIIIPPNNSTRYSFEFLTALEAALRDQLPEHNICIAKIKQQRYDKFMVFCYPSYRNDTKSAAIIQTIEIALSDIIEQKR